MASLQFDRASKRWQIRFYFAGLEYKRSLKIKSERQAQSIQGRVEETIRLLESGRLELPAGADLAVFILADGKQTQKPSAKRPITLDGSSPRIATP
jgi:hypothetical protein